MYMPSVIDDVSSGASTRVGCLNMYGTVCRRGNGLKQVYDIVRRKELFINQYNRYMEIRFSIDGHRLHHEFTFQTHFAENNWELSIVRESGCTLNLQPNALSLTPKLMVNNIL